MSKCKKIASTLNERLQHTRSLADEPKVVESKRGKILTLFRRYRRLPIRAQRIASSVSAARQAPRRGATASAGTAV